MLIKTLNEQDRLDHEMSQCSILCECLVRVFGTGPLLAQRVALGSTALAGASYLLRFGVSGRTLTQIDFAMSPISPHGAIEES
jgi:hypothetical protein